MIKIDGLSFGYSHRINLFESLDLEINSGQIHGLLGLNGAGKSTLLHLAQGLRYPKSGSIRVFGNNPADRDIYHLQDSFLLPEEIYAPSISLKRFVDRYAPFYPSFSIDQFLKLLNEFELDRKSQLGNLSMGQQKKALIAFGLATNTKVLMMDEPTNGLDIPSKKQFRKILTHIIREDRLFIISTHQIRDLHSLIDNVLVLSDGKIIFNNTIEHICDRLHFSLSRQPEKTTNLIYNERVPGGYLNIQPAKSGESFEPDLEVLFNAIITKNDLINSAFQKRLIHDN